MTPDGGKGVRADDLVLLGQLRRDLVLTVVNTVMVIVFMVIVIVVNMIMVIMTVVNVMIYGRTVFPLNDCYEQMRWLCYGQSNLFYIENFQNQSIFAKTKMTYAEQMNRKFHIFKAVAASASVRLQIGPI